MLICFKSAASGNLITFGRRTPARCWKSSPGTGRRAGIFTVEQLCRRPSPACAGAIADDVATYRQRLPPRPSR